MKKCNDYLQTHLMEKQIFNRASTLATKINEAILAKQEQDFEQLDKEIAEGKSRQNDNAGKSKQVSMGGPPELNKAIQMVLYWKGMEAR